MQPNEAFMRRAIEFSKQAGIDKKTGGAFGTVVVKDGKIIGEGYNQVIKNNDPTWHGEMQAIREACQYLRSPHLEGCVIYTSAELCPMCMAACYWAHIDHVFYAASMADVMQYGNFEDENYYEELAKDPNDRRIGSSNFMRIEAIEIWKLFEKMPNKVHY